MSEERKQILTMLAEGKITADDAERLLEKLRRGEADDGKSRGWGHRRRKRLNIRAAALPDGGDGAAGGSNGNAETDRSKAAAKYLRVEVHSTDGDEVSVRVPLRLIRTGVKLTTMLPSETNAKLADKGIDLGQLGKLEGEELIDALRELKVDVDSANGDTVRVFCE